MNKTRTSSISVSFEEIKPIPYEESIKILKDEVCDDVSLAEYPCFADSNKLVLGKIIKTSNECILCINENDSVITLDETASQLANNFKKIKSFFKKTADGKARSHECISIVARTL